MKKIFILFLSVLCMCLVSCTTADDLQNPNKPEKVVVDLLGDVVKTTSNGNDLLPNTRAGMNKKRAGSQNAIFQSWTNYNWQYPFDLIKAMPESDSHTVLNYGNIQDYCFVADDTEFDIVALYANGMYYHEVKLHYQIDDERGVETIFDDRPLFAEKKCSNCDGKGEKWVGWPITGHYETCSVCNGTGKQGNWYDPYKNGDGNNKKGIISRQNSTAPSVHVAFPAKTIFWFEIISYTKDRNGKFNRNEDGGLSNDWFTVKALNKNDKCQSVTFALEGWTLIGFEDINYAAASCDRDFNDVVIALNPIQYVSVEPTVTDDGKVETTEENTKKQEEYEQDEETGEVTKKDTIVTPPTPPEEVIDTIPTPAPDPVQTLTQGLVETNWAVNQQINEKGDTTNYSKVSIHVRDTTDIVVVIPIGLAYQCESDDFAIVAKHDAAVSYNTANTLVEYDINGDIVRLSISHQENCIVIESFGITAEVLKYLRETYDDGVTFEIWTWMGVMPTVANGTATIEFKDNDPLYYLNRMNNDGQSNDYEFVAPEGYGSPELIFFEESNSHYKTQIYKRINNE